MGALLLLQGSEPPRQRASQARGLLAKRVFFSPSSANLLVSIPLRRGLGANTAGFGSECAEIFLDRPLSLPRASVRSRRVRRFPWEETPRLGPSGERSVFVPARRSGRENSARPLRWSSQSIV
ncbi:unnamed protein product [Musa textilis]